MRNFKKFIEKKDLESLHEYKDVFETHEKNILVKHFKMKECFKNQKYTQHLHRFLRNKKDVIVVSTKCIYAICPKKIEDYYNLFSEEVRSTSKVMGLKEFNAYIATSWVSFIEKFSELIILKVRPGGMRHRPEDIAGTSIYVAFKDSWKKRPKSKKHHYDLRISDHDYYSFCSCCGRSGERYSGDFIISKQNFVVDNFQKYNDLETLNFFDLIKEKK